MVAPWAAQMAILKAVSKAESTVVQMAQKKAEHWAATRAVHLVDTMDGPKAAEMAACSVVLSAVAMAACWVVDLAVQRVALTDSSWAVPTAETKAV